MAPTAVRASDAVTGGKAESSIAPASGEGSGDEDNPFWPDETVEVAFLSDAKDRGETPTPGSAAVQAEMTEENSDRAALPPLDDLVKRIPSDVRDTLDELFRAKFVTVKRLPKKAFKT